MADSYRQYFCPVTRGSEILASRWTPIILRNMLLGSTTFSEILEGAPGMPRSLLSERLRALEYSGVVQRREKPSGRGHLYELTPAGEELQPVIDAIGRWGARWLEAVPADLDAGVLLWAICKAMVPERFPAERVVVRIELSDAPRRPYWLLVERPEPEVCVRPPGFDEDLVLRSDTHTLARWHMGHATLGGAMRARTLTIEGPRHLVREFATWGGESPYADVKPHSGG